MPVCPGPCLAAMAPPLTWREHVSCRDEVAYLASSPSSDLEADSFPAATGECAWHTVSSAFLFYFTLGRGCSALEIERRHPRLA